MPDDARPARALTTEARDVQVSADTEGERKAPQLSGREVAEDLVGAEERQIVLAPVCDGQSE